MNLDLPKTFLLGVIFLAGSVLDIHAQLAFPADIKEVHPDMDTTEIKIEFPFINMGDTPITIKTIQPSCGCTVAASDKMTYAPGEKGTIKATYTTHGATGLQEKEIAVTTVEAPDAVKVLTIKAYIPALISFSPASVKWTVGDAVASKTINVRFVSGKAVKLVGIDINTDRAIAKLTTVKEDESYTITITPLSTNQPTTGIVMVKLLLPTSNPTRVAYYRFSIDAKS